jgi:ATP-dependent Clp protease ATP-binding subunit ClpC
VDFKNTVVIMTSNAGADIIKREGQIGFATPKDKTTTQKQGYEDMKKKVLTELQKRFRPEFLNRLDDIIVFHQLSEEQLESIVELMVKDLKGRLAERKLGLELTEAAKAWLVKQGYDPVYGARPLKRAVERYVENPLSARILRGEFTDGDSVLVNVEGEGLTFSVKKGAKATA